MASPAEDTAESIETKAAEVLCHPTPTLADAIAAVRIKGDLEAITNASFGACFSDLAEIITLYTKVNSMKQKFLDEESKSICATFSNKVDASIAEAFVAFKDSYKQLNALAGKYEPLAFMSTVMSHESRLLVRDQNSESLTAVIVLVTRYEVR